MSPLDFHPEAEQEVREARRWYAQHHAVAAERYVEALDRAVAAIAEAPDRWPLYLHGTRRVLLRRFPFAVIYRVADRVLVLAVAHQRRLPGYWRSR